ncbi:hypothetical protein, partial [Apilactobacillus ozensis]|uniref:hypothetical protein n=1 Tax=Apilactobacillus ozensis TaxID=866801 RepID=UPI0006D1DFF9
MSPNANLFVSGSEIAGGTNVNLTGNMTLNRGSHMTIISRGNGASSVNGSSYGVYLTGGSSKLILSDRSVLNIIPDSSNSSSTYANGIYSSGNINVNGGTINIKVASNSLTYGEAFYVSGGNVTVSNNGKININVDSNGGSYVYPLYVSGGNVNIVDRGNLNVQVNRSASGNAIVLLNGKIYVNNPGLDGVKFTINDVSYNRSNKIVNGQVNGYSTKVVTDQNNSQLAYKYTYNGSAQILKDNNQLDSNYETPLISLFLESVPSVYFAGPVIVSDDKKTASGYIKISGYDPVGYPSNNSILSDSSSSDNSWTNKSSSSSQIDVNNSNKDKLIPFTFNIGSSNNQFNLSYGVNKIGFKYNPNNNSYSILSNDSDNTGQTISSGNYFNINNGTNDGINDVANDSSSYKNENSYIDADKDYANAYDGAQQGYNAYLKNPNVKVPDVSNIDSPNINSYQKGYEQAVKDATATEDGQEAFLNGGKSNSSGNLGAYDKNYNKSYNDAQEGYNDAQNKKSPAQSSDAYMAGFNSVSETKAGYEDASKNINDGRNHTSDSNVDKAYNGAVKGYQDAMSGKAKNPSDNSLAYRDAYNEAYPSGQKSAVVGSNAFINGLENPASKDSNGNVGSDYDSQAKNQGYQ